MSWSMTIESLGKFGQNLPRNLLEKSLSRNDLSSFVADLGLLIVNKSMVHGHMNKNSKKNIIQLHRALNGRVL